MKNLTMVKEIKTPEFLKEISRELKTAWVFLHRNIIEELCRDCDVWDVEQDDLIQAIWQGNHDMSVKVRECQLAYPEGWYEIITVRIESLFYPYPVIDPDDVLFYKLEN